MCAIASRFPFFCDERGGKFTLRSGSLVFCDFLQSLHYGKSKGGHSGSNKLIIIDENDVLDVLDVRNVTKTQTVHLSIINSHVYSYRKIEKKKMERSRSIRWIAGAADGWKRGFTT